MRIGIFFGGHSREREISFAGGRTVYDNLDKSLFEAIPIFVDSFGNFILLEWAYLYKGSIRDFYPPTTYQPQTRNFQIYADSLGELNRNELEEIAKTIGKKIGADELKSVIDFAFLVLHGRSGEDGALQGLLQYLNIPFTASGILPSAIGMDKAFQKRIMSNSTFVVSDYITLKRDDWLHSNQLKKRELFKACLHQLNTPFVIKAANQGSSIGAKVFSDHDFDLFCAMVNSCFFVQEINKQNWNILNNKIKFIQELVDIRAGLGLPLIYSTATTIPTIIYHPEKLLNQIENHFKNADEAILLSALDEEQEVVIEAFIEGKEFSCVVLRTEEGEIITLPPTGIIKGRELYDYRSKYLPGLSRKQTPIDLPSDQVNAIQEECKRLFDFLGFDVYARIDGFIQADGTILLNDPNTTSGMLPSSFFFHQAAEIGLNPSQFITFIIRASLQERLKDLPNNWYCKQLIQQLDHKIKDLQGGQQQKKRVGVILGGYSSERHISVESGRNIYEKLASSNKYQPIPIFLTGDENQFELYEIPINILLKDNADDIRDKIKNFKIHPITEKTKQAAQSIIKKYVTKDAVAIPKALSLQDLKSRVDLVFIALHGRPGEDGTLQKELVKLGLPYNGSNHASSQVTIDKYRTNQFLAQHGVYTADQLLVEAGDWSNQPETIQTKLSEAFGYPFIAKPVDDGCSSAVKKIDSPAELTAFAELIFRKDAPLAPQHAQTLGLKLKELFPQKKVFLAESLITQKQAKHFLEITGGLLTHWTADGQLTYEMFEPSEALASSAILSLEEKFLAGQGQNITPPRFDKDPKRQQAISEQVKAELKKVAQLLQVEGYARIDAFVKIMPDDSVQVYIIEINSLPGMTPATAIFHQCALNGYTPYAFIDHILSFGEKRQYTYPTRSNDNDEKNS